MGSDDEVPNDLSLSNEKKNGSKDRLHLEYPAKHQEKRTQVVIIKYNGIC